MSETDNDVGGPGSRPQLCPGEGRRVGRTLLAALLAGSLAASGCDVFGGDGPQVGPGLEPPVEQMPDPLAGVGSDAPTLGPGTLDQDTEGGGDANRDGSFGNPTTGTAGGGAQPTDPGAGSPTPGTDVADPAPTAPGAPADSCGGERFTLRPESDYYLVLDESLSMLEPADLWAPLGEALGAWLGGGALSGAEASLLAYQGACGPDAYADPLAPWGSLPAHAETLLATLEGREHAAGASTTDALAGAMEQARAHAVQVQRPVSLILVAASTPSACGSNVPATALVAAQGPLSVPAVTTHVVALGAAAGGYDLVAAGGGTASAVVVEDPTSGQEIQQALTTALEQDGCRYGLPPEASLSDPSLLNVFIVETGGRRVVPRASGPCTDTGGYALEAMSTQATVVLCPVTCDELLVGGGTLEVELGCPTVVGP